MARNGKLSPAQRRAVAALLSERDTRAAAEMARVGERTLHRWLKEDSFKAALREAESSAIDLAVRRLAELSGGAAETLEREMNNADAPPGARIRAAEAVLAHVVNMRKLHGMEERIAALEKALGESGDEN